MRLNFMELLVLGAVLSMNVIIAFPGWFWKGEQEGRDAVVRRELRSMAGAMEWYRGLHGHYPDSESVLLSAAPPYLEAGHCGVTITGYRYDCHLDAKGYRIEAVPVHNANDGVISLSSKDR